MISHIKTASIILLLALTSCAGSRFIPGKSGEFPVLNQKGKTGIVAHRGFWNCEEAGYAQNSIAALKAAQDNGFWGSELDIHVTSDNVVIVNHDNSINGVVIADNPYSAFAEMTLSNGEHPLTLDQYLTQGEKCKTTVLVIELKHQPSKEKDDILWENTVSLLKRHKLFKPERVAFISFDHYLSKRIAAEAPQFVNQYLSGNIEPETLCKEGINGIDYQEKVMKRHPEYYRESHDSGMSVNVWTVNSREGMSGCISSGADQITTNEPLMLREVLGDKEFRLKR